MFKLLAAIVGLITITLTHATGENCYQINKIDAKNLCLAAAKKDVNYCYQILGKDQKNMCLAVVKRDKSYCYHISSKDEKNMCLGSL